MLFKDLAGRGKPKPNHSAITRHSFTLLQRFGTTMEEGDQQHQQEQQNVNGNGGDGVDWKQKAEETEAVGANGGDPAAAAAPDANDDSKATVEEEETDDMKEDYAAVNDIIDTAGVDAETTAASSFFITNGDDDVSRPSKVPKLDDSGEPTDEEPNAGDGGGAAATANDHTANDEQGGIIQHAEQNPKEQNQQGQLQERHPPSAMPDGRPPPHFMMMPYGMASPPGLGGVPPGDGSGAANGPGGMAPIPPPHHPFFQHGVPPGMPYPPHPFGPYGYGGPPPPYGHYPMMPPNIAQMEFDRRMAGIGGNGNGGTAPDSPSGGGPLPTGNHPGGTPPHPPPGAPPQFGFGPHGEPTAAAAAAMHPYAYASFVAGYGWQPPPHPNARGLFHSPTSTNGSASSPQRRPRSDKKPKEPEEPPQPVPKLDREYNKVVDMSIESDPGSVSKLQNLARQQIEFFEATEKDVTAGARGRNFPITEGQVGIRCKHCKDEPFQNRGRASCYFPTRHSLIYQTGINMTSTHLLQQCTKMPQDLRDELLRLKDQRSNAGAGKGYWAKSAKDLGIIETTKGLRFTE